MLQPPKSVQVALELEQVEGMTQFLVPSAGHLRPRPLLHLLSCANIGQQVRTITCLNFLRFGLYSVFLIGLLLASLSAVLFGTITFVSQLGLFLVFAYLVRFIEGVSMAVLWSTVLAILSAIFPTRPAAVYSLLDTTYGLGLSLGPVLGSLLFSFSGFRLSGKVAQAGRKRSSVDSKVLGQL